MAAITNDIYTIEDAKILARESVLPEERIIGLETGGCPHTAIREDTSMNEAAIEQNEQMKRISSWAAILFAPSIIGSVYGMNFRFMPELSWVWGYPMALGLMLVTGVVLYVVFRFKRWL